MRVLIIGAPPGFNAEGYYCKALRELGSQVDCLDQYIGVSRRFLWRILLTRTRAFHPLLSAFPINKKAPIVANGLRPDFILVFKGELLSESAILRLMKIAPTYLFYPDNYKWPALLQNRLRLFSGLFTAASRLGYYRQLGARNVWYLPWAADPKVHRPMKLKKIRDVAFVGSPYLRRYRILRSLGSVDVFGPYWIFPVGQMHGPVYGEDLARVFNESRVNLEIRHPMSLVSDDICMRTFEVAATGAFLLSDYVPSAVQFFPMVPTYGSIGELQTKTSYFLGHPAEREAIGEGMRDLCLAKHTYLHRASLMLKTVG